jgi:asparagine synthetase B (glutamine-hydrolysing)
MCGIFYIHLSEKKKQNKILNNIQNIIQKIKYRGPDKINMETHHDFIMVHTLLAIQGFEKQPMKHNNKILLFNGEIYGTSLLDYTQNSNFLKIPDEFKNDGKFLIDFFENKNGLENLDILDGEFVINYFDFDNNRLHLITDPFYTKPLCIYNNNGNFIVSSYESCIIEALKTLQLYNTNSQKIIKFLRPNTHYVIDLNTYKVLSKKEIIKWDFIPRFNDFSRWNNAFENSVKKRTDTDKKIFVPLSSGYDSGCICASLLNLTKKFDTYTFKGRENKNILEQRKVNIEKDEVNKFTYIDTKKNISNKYEEYCTRIENSYAFHQNGNIYADIYGAYSCFGMYQIFQEARERGQIIFLSGHGGDEIFSDYGNVENRGASSLCLDYTNIREKWPNFDSSYGRNIIQMFERVAGCYGIESRYPFLDKQVVQEFLWLGDGLKNKEFKQCIAQYMRKSDFPFLQNKKCSVRVLTDEDGGHESFFKIAEGIQKKLGLYNKYINKPTNNNLFWKQNGIHYWPPVL